MTNQGSTKQLWREALALGAVFLLGAAVETSRTTSFFDPFDHSGFLDLFYRVYSGQKLYVDFFYNAGPVHAYIGAFFYWLLGPGISAVKANACMLSLFMAAYAYMLGRSSFGIPVSTALATLATLFFVGPFSFPTYDHHAWLFLLLAIAFLRFDLSKNVVLNASLRGGICGTLIALSVLTKANIGAFGAVIVAGVLILLPERKRALMWLGLGFILCLNLVFFLLGTTFEFFQANFVEYAPGARLTAWGLLNHLLHDIPYVPMAFGTVAIALAGGRDYVVRERRDFAILTGLIGTSIFSVWTSSMISDLNTFALGLELVLLVVLVKRLPKGLPESPEYRLYRCCAVMLAGACVLVFFTGIERTWRLGFFKSRLPSLEAVDYEIKSPPLKGWRCNHFYCEGMDEVVEFMRTHVPRQDSLFVFPDMQIIYQMTGHSSYLHAPYEFVLNILPGPGKPTTAFLNYFDANAPKWVVIHSISFLPNFDVDTGQQLKSLFLDEYFTKNYSHVWRGKYFTLLKHN